MIWTTLDEYSEEQLTNELERRKILRAQGLCDYCKRQPTETPCMFPQRHYFKVELFNYQKEILNDFMC